MFSFKTPNGLHNVAIYLRIAYSYILYIYILYDFKMLVRKLYFFITYKNKIVRI
jgi:hypothetical protein